MQELKWRGAGKDFMDVENCIGFRFMMAMENRGLKKCSRLSPVLLEIVLRKDVTIKLEKKMSKSFGKEGRERVQINKVES